MDINAYEIFDQYSTCITKDDKNEISTLLLQHCRAGLGKGYSPRKWSSCDSAGVIVNNCVKILTAWCKVAKIKDIGDTAQSEFPHHSLLARGMRSHFGHPANQNIVLAPCESEYFWPPVNLNIRTKLSTATFCRFSTTFINFFSELGGGSDHSKYLYYNLFSELKYRFLAHHWSLWACFCLFNESSPYKTI